MDRSTPLLLIAMLLLAGCAAPTASLAEAAIPKLVIAIQPTDNAGAIQDRATELEAFLEETMRASGTPADIEILVPLTYVGVVEALRFGHADAALMGAWPARMAVEKAGAQIVLAEQREVKHGAQSVVAPYYYSYYIVPTDSPITTLADLQGKSVAYPSGTSTSGYIFPVAHLVSEGLVAAPVAGAEADPRGYFGSVRFAGGYAQGWEALKAGQVDAAVIAGDVNAKLYDEVLSQTRVIATMGPVPSHAVVFSSEFQGPERDALKAALLELKGEKKDLMRKLVSGIFVEFAPTTSADHTSGLATALELTGLKFQEKLG